MDFKPYIELFTDYLQRKAPHQVQASVNLSMIANVRAPWLWFPVTREKFGKRHFHYHVGPTNSGKTRQALEILKNAKSGLYLSPLRMLTMEVHAALTQSGKDPDTGLWHDGIVCNLKTGPLR